MFGLTPLGVIHTAISLIAVAAGVVCFVRYGGISLRNTTGKSYVIMTVLTCLTGFGIFQHGGFGIPHVLGIVTLVVLALAVVAEHTRLFGTASRYVETVSYSATFFFHMIPGVTETFTRLPAGAPLFESPDAPALQSTIGVIFVLFIAGSAYQMWRLRAGQRSVAIAA
ncbi:MAG: hypothetical protein WD795_15575 [Woeseia sp.]